MQEKDIDHLIAEYEYWLKLVKESISYSYMKRIEMYNMYSYDFNGHFPTAIDYIINSYANLSNNYILNHLYGLKNSYYIDIERQTSVIVNSLAQLYLMKPVKIVYNSSNCKLIENIIEKKE